MRNLLITRILIAGVMISRNAPHMRAAWRKVRLLRTPEHDCCSTSWPLVSPGTRLRLSARAFSGSVRDPYRVLGLIPGATKEEVKRAYRKKAMEFHPDKPGGDEAKFKEATAAMERILKGGAQQSHPGFDFHAHQGAGFPGAAPPGFEDIFREMEEMARDIERQAAQSRAGRAGSATGGRAGARQGGGAGAFVVSQFQSTVQNPDGSVVTRIQRQWSDGRVEVEETQGAGGMSKEDAERMNKQMRSLLFKVAGTALSGFANAVAARAVDNAKRSVGSLFSRLNPFDSSGNPDSGREGKKKR